MYVQNLESVWLDCSISKDILQIMFEGYLMPDSSWYLTRLSYTGLKHMCGRLAKCFTGYPFVSAVTSDTVTVANYPLGFHRLGSLTTAFQDTFTSEWPVLHSFLVSCPTRRSLNWPLALCVDHQSPMETLHILSTERQGTAMYYIVSHHISSPTGPMNE